MLLNDLDETELEVLTFTDAEAANLYWEHSSEFEFQDKMYDVLEERHSNGYVTYICWPDEEESNLNRLLEQLATQANQQDQNQNDGNRNLTNFFDNLFYTSNEASICSFELLLTEVSQAKPQLYKNIHPDTLTPPPRG